MATTPRTTFKLQSKPHPTAPTHDDEERKGLLSNDDNFPDDTPDDSDSSSWPRKKVIGVAVGFIALLVCGVFARALLRGQTEILHPNLAFHGGELRSNGTHEFKRTVLIVSIDGLRADYLDRGLTPHLLDISKQGLRAKSMIPIFPTLTFPNHWALMTGLYAESHGIVANNFWDPVSQSEFHYNQVSSCWNPEWWFGEPMWESAGKAGIITANLMWPGPPKTRTGATSSYFVPWKDKVPLQEKLDQIVSWIDLPLEERPQLIMAYEPSLDQAGHLAGPNSALVNKTLTQVDTFAKSLHTALKRRNLTDIVDIVFVSDHGMTDTSHPALIYLDDILNSDSSSNQSDESDESHSNKPHSDKPHSNKPKSNFDSIEHIDGWPSMGLRFAPSANQSYLLDLLVQAADKSRSQGDNAGEGAFDVYEREYMPERWHFSENERIAPVYVVPKIGYALTTRKEGDVGMTKGNHGYDNADLPMHAMFVAHGPFSAVVKALHQKRSRSLAARYLHRPNKGWHSVADDTYVMDRFQNVEIYNLVMKLLGVEGAETNGTRGFWDEYF